MSATVDTQTLTVQERSALATRMLCQALGLGALKPADLKFLALALTEVATAEIEAQTGLGERVRAAFEQVQTDYSTKGKRTTSKSKKSDTLSAVGDVDPAKFAPGAATDPYALLELYGREQLRAALNRYPASELKKAAAIVEARNPGTKPTNRAQKIPLLDYIMQHV